MSLSDELLSLSSVEMRRRIGTKEVSPVELVEASIARIEALNPTINAIAATDFAHARKLAISAESAARKGEQLGPLHGLPTGIKDLHETAGLLTTYGSPLYRGHGRACTQGGRDHSLQDQRAGIWSRREYAQPRVGRDRKSL